MDLLNLSSGYQTLAAIAGGILGLCLIAKRLPGFFANLSRINAAIDEMLAKDTLTSLSKKGRSSFERVSEFILAGGVSHLRDRGAIYFSCICSGSVAIFSIALYALFGAIFVLGLGAENFAALDRLPETLATLLLVIGVSGARAILHFKSLSGPLPESLTLYRE